MEESNTFRNGSSQEITMFSSNLLTDFEKSYESCLGLLAHSQAQQQFDLDEVRSSAEECTHEFLENAHLLKSAFIRLRASIASRFEHLQEQDQLRELDIQIERRKQMIRRLQQKADNWLTLLSDANLASQAVGPPTRSQMTSSGMQGNAFTGATGSGPSIGMHQPGYINTPGASLQGPLAYLERTTSSIGHENRR